MLDSVPVTSRPIHHHRRRPPEHRCPPSAPKDQESLKQPPDPRPGDRRRLYREAMRREQGGNEQPEQYRDGRGRKAWIAEVRNNPKKAMEADLGVAVAGLGIFVVGGVVAVAGFHPWWQNIHDNSPTPLLGNIVAVFGLLVAAAGLVLLVISLVIWLTGRHRESQTGPKSEDEALLQSIRDDGHRDRPV